MAISYLLVRKITLAVLRIEVNGAFRESAHGSAIALQWKCIPATFGSELDVNVAQAYDLRWLTVIMICWR